MNQVKHCFFCRKLTFDTTEKMTNNNLKQYTITFFSEEIVEVVQKKKLKIKGANNNELEVFWIHTITSG